MKTWKNIKKLPKNIITIYSFNDNLSEKYNKFKNYWINISFDSKNKVYSVSFFGSPVNRNFKKLYSCYRFIYNIAVEYMQYNKSFIDYFLKSKDLL